MRICIVDAFTDRPFAGNPAGVVLLESDAFPPDAWLQNVAAEVNLSETARTGLVRTTVQGDRVLLTGTAVTVVDGELHPVP